MSVEPTDGTFLIFGQLWYVDVITITSLFSYKCNVGLPDKWFMQKKWNLYAHPWFYRPPNLVWPGNPPPPPQKKKRKRKRVFFQYPTSSHLLYCSNHSIDKPTLSILSWTCPEQDRKDKRKQRTNIETIDFRRKFDFYYFCKKKKKKKKKELKVHWPQFFYCISIRFGSF